MRRIEAWITDDGTTFENEQEARTHEAFCRLLVLWSGATSPPMDSAGFAHWVLEHGQGFIHALEPITPRETTTP